MPLPLSAAARILVIEDDASVSTMLERTLTKAGHEVTLAGTGAEGQKALAGGTFELVILDKNLPDMDGMRLLKDFRVTHPEVPAIVITADPTAPTRLAAQGLGAFAYLGKPFALGALVSLCTSALNSSSPTLVRARVLVVDDDDSVGQLARTVLKREGFEVEVAATRVAAVSSLERRYFDLLLVDWHLMGADGMQLANLARQKWPRIAVILMSAGQPPSLEMLAQADAHLGKPFHNLRALIDEIRRVLKLKADGTPHA